MNEDRLRRDAAALRGRADAVADTETALGAVVASRPPSRHWAVLSAAAVVAVAVLGVVAMTVRDDEPSSIGAATQTLPTTVPPSPVPTSAAPSPSTVADTVPVASTSPSTTTASDEPGTSVWPDCTYTDPARRSINVFRARECPDGTEVWVYGVVVETAAGTLYLCAERPEDPGDGCPDTGLRIIGQASTTAEELTGVKRGATLTIAGRPPCPAGAPCPTVVPPSDPPPPPPTG